MNEPPDTTDYFTRYLALYGATIATLGFGWQLYQRWLRGPKLSVDCSPNMVMAGNGSIATQRHLSITIQNSGTETTTITNVTFAGFKCGTLFPRLFRRESNRQAVILTHPTLGNVVPFEIKVGGRFHTLALQNEDMVKWSNDEDLYVRIFQSFSKRASWCRIKPIAKPN
jgi:hypothetical protein